MRWYHAFGSRLLAGLRSDMVGGRLGARWPLAMLAKLVLLPGPGCNDSRWTTTAGKDGYTV